MEWKAMCVCVCVFVTVVAQSVTASLFSKHYTKYQHSHHKQLPHAAKLNTTSLDKSCECRVELADGTLLKDFGKMAHYKTGTCHQVHHQCRVSCTAALHLRAHLPDTTTTRGYHYCDLYGRTTTNLGVSLRAVWRTSHCHQHRRHASRKVARLCCGHTSLPLTSENHHVVAKVFGWNPDCRAQTFVVAS